jgi:hypothetical protein
MGRRVAESAVGLPRLGRSGRVLVHGRSRGHGSDVDEGGVLEQTEVTKFGATQGVVCVLVGSNNFIIAMGVNDEDR